MIKEEGMSVAMVTGCRRSLGSWVCPYKLNNTGSSSIIKEAVPLHTQAFTENKLKPKRDPQNTVSRERSAYHHLVLESRTIVTGSL